MDKSTIWVEKYRPTEFSDVVGLPASIPDLCNQNIPCLLFDGRAGTGKTTTARIIVNKLDADCLELNASNERGIDVIRKKVHQFASSMSSNQKIKKSLETGAFNRQIKKFLIIQQIPQIYSSFT